MFNVDINTIYCHKIREGLKQAIENNLLPSITENVYPGHFMIVSDGQGFGKCSTWPGLDSWQMAGAFLLLGKKQLVIDYFDFVKASQRNDGNIPLGIVPGDLEHQDTKVFIPMGIIDPVINSFTYTYKKSMNESIEYVSKNWISIFNHWQKKKNPLLICKKAEIYEAHASELLRAFNNYFWKGNHFAEFLHPTHGIVDKHGLTDVNWAAVAFDIADKSQMDVLWPQLMKQNMFWYGEMPTQIVANPFVFDEWELNEELEFELDKGPLYDIAAMGRVWYLEALACVKMNEYDRLTDSVIKVCEMGEKYNWKWFERYHPMQNMSVSPAGPSGYCEYPSVLLRIVFDNIELFK